MDSAVASLVRQAYDNAAAHPGAVALSSILVALLYKVYTKPDLSQIPAVGSTGLMAYRDAYRFIWEARNILNEGFRKFNGGPFKVPLIDKWVVLLASEDMIEEMKSAKDSDLSFGDAIAQTMQTRHTVGENITSNTYHSDVVRTPLTRNLGTKFDEIHEEIVQAFEELIPAEKDWKPIPALYTVQQVICRATNRLLLGLPMCRNPEWIELNIRYTIDVAQSASIINLAPGPLKAFVGWLISPKPRALKLGQKYFKQEITERLKMDDEYGKEYDGRPNDAISWLLEYAKGEERTVDNLISRLLFMNVAAIHTSSFSFTQALYNLAAYPEYVAPMREEVFRVIDEEGGWSKSAVNKMVKLDSFLRESSRFQGNDAVMVNRIVSNPAGYTFANGVHLPCGTHVGAASYLIHHDNGVYADADKFDGFRFSKLRVDDNQNVKHHLVAANSEYLHFGIGKHACPGRFFAAAELKTMLAHILMNYDVKLEGEAKPDSFWNSFLIIPDPAARIMFRRRG